MQESFALVVCIYMKPSRLPYCYEIIKLRSGELAFVYDEDTGDIVSNSEWVKDLYESERQVPRVKKEKKGPGIGVCVMCGGPTLSKKSWELRTTCSTACLYKLRSQNQSRILISRGNSFNRGQKISYEIAKQIRKEYRKQFKRGRATSVVLAEKYGIMASTVRAIIGGKIWKTRNS